MCWEREREKFTLSIWKGSKKEDILIEQNSNGL